MTKPATTDHPIVSHIAERWSPRAFSERALSDDDLNSLFEAARWSSSCYNAQPWHFIYARRDEPAFDTLLACINERNGTWAKNASVLLIAVAKSTHEDGSPNGHAEYDLGQAVATLSIEATARDLYVHQMAGFHPEKAHELLGVPDGYVPKTAIAIGYIGDPSILSESQAEREAAPRVRRPIADFVFKDRWPG